MKTLATLVAGLLLVVSADAQNINGNEFATTTQGKTVIGQLGMCINSSNQAVPIGPACANPITVNGSTVFGSAFPSIGGGPTALDIGGISQPWWGLSAAGVNYGLVGVVDQTGSQLNGLVPGLWGTPSSQVLSTQNNDPCSYAAKSSVPISVTSATTTSLVAVSGSTTVYACGISFSLAPSAISADTALFEYGTGAACTTPTVLTGTYGNGDLTTAAPPVVVSYGGGGSTIFKSASSSGICLLTAGTTVNVQGVMTYVQQ